MQRIFSNIRKTKAAIKQINGALAIKINQVHIHLHLLSSLLAYMEFQNSRF